MTLKERLKEEPIVLYKDSYNMTNQSAESLEQIADEFAIGFGEWLVSYAYSQNDMYWWLIKTNGDVRKSTKELLEIYKKEKGL